MKKLKRLIPTAICTLAVMINCLPVSSAVTYYEITEKHNISKTLTYETSRGITDEGFLDVHVIKVPLDDPHISISPVNSAAEYGLKETATKILNDRGAVAGINGDFFGMDGSYSVPLGTEIINGSITAASTYTNSGKNESAGLFINSDGSPFVEYLKFEIAFHNDGVKNIEVAAINKTVDAVYPTVFTRAAIKSTRSLDARIKSLFKVVVENDVIVNKTYETVEVPENGYIIVMSRETAALSAVKFSKGQRAILEVKPSFDLSKVTSAIGGAGKLLQNGAIANATGFVSGGRHPRTAVGYTKDKKTLIMMVVDGRGGSIGATHAEMAELMLKYGAYDAMHLDGGGSSVLAAKDISTGTLGVINTPSDGGQRRVINALGVFMNAPIGNVAEICIEAETETAIPGQPIELKVYGVDAYYNRVELDETKINLYSGDGSGSFLGMDYYPYHTGVTNIYAEYEGIIGKLSIISDYLAVIKPSVSEITASENGTAEVSFTGIDSEGNSIKLDPSVIKYEVFPENLGEMDGGVFTAKKLGSGWIRCFSGDISAYIKLNINLTATSLEPLNGAKAIKYSSYPEVEGNAEYIKYGDEFATQTGIGLNYIFTASDVSQAAYAVFNEPILLPENSAGLRAAVFGQFSLDMIRGQIVDGDGTVWYLTFTRRIDFDGWKDLDALIPSNAKHPLYLERIYAVSLPRRGESFGSVCFDDLRSLSKTEVSVSEESMPVSTVYKDRLDAGTFDEPLAENGYEFTTEELKFNASAYRVVSTDKFYSVQIRATNGGIYNTDIKQWSVLEKDITNNPLPFLIVQTDKSPLRFYSSREFSLFHEMLTGIIKGGKKVFVISSDSGAAGTTVKDGVRYINLKPRYDGEVLNEDFKILRFRVTGGDVGYAFEKIVE